MIVFEFFYYEINADLFTLVNIEMANNMDIFPHFSLSQYGNNHTKEISTKQLLSTHHSNTITGKLLQRVHYMYMYMYIICTCICTLYVQIYVYFPDLHHDGCTMTPGSYETIQNIVFSGTFIGIIIT